VTARSHTFGGVPECLLNINVEKILADFWRQTPPSLVQVFVLWASFLKTWTVYAAREMCEKYWCNTVQSVLYRLWLWSDTSVLSEINFISYQDIVSLYYKKIENQRGFSRCRKNCSKSMIFSNMANCWNCTMIHHSFWSIFNTDSFLVERFRVHISHYLQINHFPFIVY